MDRIPASVLCNSMPIMLEPTLCSQSFEKMKSVQEGECCVIEWNSVRLREQNTEYPPKGSYRRNP